MSITDNLCLSQTICVCPRHTVSVKDNLCQRQSVTVTNRLFLKVACFRHKTPLPAISVNIYVIFFQNCPANRRLSVANGAHGAHFVEPWCQLSKFTFKKVDIWHMWDFISCLDEDNSISIFGLFHTHPCYYILYCLRIKY